jgi:Tol biopolymer transport system component
MQNWQTIVAGVDLARAAAPDTILLARGAELDAMAFDPVRLAAAGPPRTVVAPVATAQGLAQYAVTSTGSLIWADAPSSSATPSGLAWWSPTGVQAAAADIAHLRAPSLSPDGTRLAGVINEGSRSDIWVADVSRGTATRLTHSGINASPIWSPDGRTIYFAARSGGAFNVWSRNTEGTQPATRVASVDGSRHAFPMAVSPDGTLLAFVQTSPGKRADIWVLPLGGGSPRAIVSGPFDDAGASFSPDSKWIAFQSADTGRWEVCLQNLDDGHRIVVSTDGGERPFWRNDGLYFQSRGQLFRAAIPGGKPPRVETVTRIGDLEGGALQGISPDGRILVRPSAESRGRAIVSLEWLREVRALLGPPATALPR